MTLALFKVVLYPRHFEHPPISIQWGKDNDHRASQKYLKHAKSHPYSDFPEHIAEFKCPFSKKVLIPIEAPVFTVTMKTDFT